MMFPMSRLHLIIYIAFLSVLTSMAQTGRLFNGDQLLSSSFVHHVYQDKMGFVWVSTDNGLNRYDGYSFLTFTESDGLTDPSVICAGETSEGNLIVGTSTGAFVKINGHFHPVTLENNGDTLRAYVTSFARTLRGGLILGSSGGGLYMMTGSTTAMPLGGADSSLQFSRSLYVDKKGILWVATEKKGIIGLRPYQKGARTEFKTMTTLLPEGNRQLPVMCADKYDNIYVGYYNGGLYKLDNQRKTLVSIPVAATLPISSLLLKRDGNILIGSNGEGLKVFNTQNGIMRDANLISQQVNLAKTKVVSILEDRNHNLWLGLFQKGVFCQNLGSSVFSTLGPKQGAANEINESCFMAIQNSNYDGTVWLSGDQDGLYHLGKNHKLLRHYIPTDSPKSVPHTVLAIKEDKQGRIWLGSYMEGCGWFDDKTGEYHRASFSYGNAQNVFDIRFDKWGRMWIATLGDGIKCYDSKTDKLTEYRAVGGDGKKLVNNYVLELEFNHDKDILFVGTAMGLSALDLKTGSWTSVFGKNALCEGQAVRAICSSRKTGLWMGTSKGLYHFDMKTRKITHYTTKDGLPSNNISSIEVDRKGEVWVSTSYGLCNINLQTNSFRTYYSSDGLQGNEYSEGASSIDEKGTLYFCGTSGVSILYTNTPRPKPIKPNVIISMLEVSGERVLSFMESGGYIVTREAVSESKLFHFSHEDNTITLYFSTLSFSGTDHVAYSYRINGDEWIKLRNGKHSLTLSRLPAGDYHFEVVANDNGTLSDIKEFDIVVHNPWYFTPFAKFVYAFFIIALILWYIHDQKMRNNQKLRLQQHMHAEELNEQKLQLFTNLSHEIRTPMTLIVTPLMQLIKEDQDSQRQATYEVIKRNAERILNLVNKILDIRKLDNGQMVMRMRETDIVAYTKEVITLFTSTATSRMVDLRLVNSEDHIPVWIDPEHFDKILVNLLSNAFKYVNAGGQVVVTLARDNNYVTITVFDSGGKIPEEHMEHIFERFYQAMNIINDSKMGTGIGLHLAHSIVMLHHGTLVARNTDAGVEFIVTIPLGDAHLKPEEKAAPIIELEEEEEKPTDFIKELIQEPEEEAEDEEDAAPVHTNSKKSVVFVVEDDDEIRNYLVAELSGTYKVVSYMDGKEALPAILREIPSLVLSDVMMPQMDGYTLCSRIKSNVNTNHVPVVLLTAKSLDEDKLEGLECGADLFVTKPFNIEVLRRSISNLLASRRLMQNKYTGKEDLSAQIDDVEVESFDEKLLARIMAVINDNLSNSDLNIDMICKEVGISRVHLHRKMKELTNQTPHDFIRNLRMKQAARLLSHKGQSVTDVMYRCGFSSATSFSTMFKKMYGMSPREYMREHAGE